MKTLSQLYESPKQATFTFGRFNPPTTGHEKLIKALASQGGDVMVFPSHSQDPKKNPLPVAKKIAYMKKMFPRYARNIMTSKSRTVFEIATELQKLGYTDVVMVVGSDRVKEFTSLLMKYNGVKGRHGFYDFETIKVLSAGERDPDAEGVEGMSASKMRAAAIDNDYDSFKLGLPKGFKQGEKLFKDIRQFMNLKETNWSFEEILRDSYIRGEIFNVNDDVSTKDGLEGKIVRKGTNYVVIETNDGMKREWISNLIEEKKDLIDMELVDEQKKITKVKQEKDIEDIKGTQPAKYYAKGVGDKKDMKKSTKVARARQFNRQAKMDDDDPNAYKPAPGDKGAKTKPSQYTKKFKQMYGEKRAKQAVSQGKVQKLVTAHGLKFKGKVYKEIDMELVKIDNSTKMVKFKIIYPKELFGNETNISFKALRRGPFMATDTSKINEKLPKDADAGDYIKDFRKSDAPQFKGKSDKKIRDMAIAAYLDAKDKKESYEIGKDYYDHAKEVDPYSAPRDDMEEKSTLKKDKKLKNLLIPKKGQAGVTRFMRRKNLQKLAADVQADIDEAMYHHVLNGKIVASGSKSKMQSLVKKSGKPVFKGKNSNYVLNSPGAKIGDIKEQSQHEITVGNYTTKFFHMCGSAQTVMKKHADKEGAEELTMMQDVFYKMEKDAMGAGGASEEQKVKSEILYDKIMTKAEDMGIASEVDKYMKLHLTSMTKGEPKLGFGRTDITESLWANIHKKRQRIKQGSGERMRKKGEKGAPTPAQMQRAKGEEVEVIDEKIAGLVTKSEKTGIPYGILKKSYDRGMAAWKTGHRPGTTPQQWAFARVNSMVTGGKADPDLQAKIRAGGYKKKKKAKKESIDEWYNDEHTRISYRERYGDEWEKNLNNTYERMLSKLSESMYDHIITEAEYEGRKVKLNDPFRLPTGSKKKFGVYVKNDKGNVVKVTFGDPNMSINRDDPAARKSFRARHQCDTNPGPKHKARYWSCFQWRAGAKVDN